MKRIAVMICTFLFLCTVVGCDNDINAAFQYDSIKDSGLSSNVGSANDDTSYEELIGNDELHRYRVYNDVGCCRSLSGKILVYCFFVDDNQSSWTKNESNKYLEKEIQPALDFIVKEAKQWDVEVSFDVKAFCNDTASFSLKYDGIINKNLADTGYTDDILNQLCVNAGFSSDYDLILGDDKKEEYNDSIYLTLINKNGRSYTNVAYIDDETYYICNDTAEHCVIFAKNNDELSSKILLENRSVTVAHEILHLFGAEDYYKSQREKLADMYYYYDIMSLNIRIISGLDIMEMTAFTVGWTDEVPELCYNSTWADGKIE